MSTFEDLAAYAVIAVAIKKRKKRRHQMWRKEWLQRKRFNHVHLLRELEAYPRDWKNYLRMDEKKYFDLLRIVTPLITKQDTKMREAITPHEKLTATLRYPSTGRTMEDLKFSTRISPQTLGRIIPETCSAIAKALNDYCKVPNTAGDWKQIAQEYGERWNFDNCLGSMDGKHIAITPPPGSGSYFYNYKGFHSQVLFCIASANYEIIYFHFGVNGRVSDGRVLKETDFDKKLTDKSLNLPEEGIVDGEALPYVFIADDAFPLTEVIMKPFSYRVANKPRKVYNYRLSRARRMVESVFGILAERFQVLQKPITFIDLKKVNSVVVACSSMFPKLLYKL